MDDQQSHSDIALARVLDAFLLRARKSNRTLFDIGIGTGIHADLALKHGYEVSAVDIVHPRRLDKRIRFRTIDLNKDALNSPQKFDLVICTEVIEHLENPHKLFADIRSVLKPHGLCFLSTPNLQSWHERLFYLLRGTFRRFPVNAQSGEHINPITLQEIAVLCRLQGFDLKQATTEGLWIPILRRYLSERFRRFIGLGLGESLIAILKKKGI